MTTEEILTATKKELHNLIELLPLAKLEALRDTAQSELEKIAASPEVKAAESRFRTITTHLWGSLQRGEHEIVTAVHNYLVHFGTINKAGEPSPDHAEATEAPGPDAAPQQ